MAFSIPNGPSNNGPDNNGFGTPAPHDPFTRRMTDAEQFHVVKYLFGNGPTFGQRDPKTEAVARRMLDNDILGNGTSRRPSFGQPGGMNTPSPSNPNGGADFGQPGSSFGTPPTPSTPSGSSFGTPGAPTNSGFGTPGDPFYGTPTPPNPLDQQPSGGNSPSDGSEKKIGLAGRLWNNVFKGADQAQKDSQTFNQQGRMADSFVAEHNARQQNAPGFGGQSFGQSFGQPRNDGPQMGF